MNTSNDSSDNKNDSVEKLRAVLSEAQQALASAGEGASDEVIHQLRERLREALDEGRVFARRAVEIAKKQACAADDFVHEKPYIALGVAAGIGVILGTLVGRRCGCRD